MMGNRIFMLRWAILLIFVAIAAIPSLLFVFPDVVWVGSTDLEVEFVVTDAAGQAVPGARIEIQSDGGFYEENTHQEFSLHTNEHGSASRICRKSMCFGRRSRLFSNTFVVHLPWWQFRVVKEGLEPTEWIYLDIPQYIKLARKTGPRTSKLVVPISLDPLAGK